MAAIPGSEVVGRYAAGPARRGVAFAVDVAVLDLVCWPILMASMDHNRVLVTGPWFALSLIYFWLPVHYRGRTLGNVVARTEIVTLEDEQRRPGAARSLLRAAIVTATVVSLTSPPGGVFSAAIVVAVNWTVFRRSNPRSFPDIAARTEVLD